MWKVALIISIVKLTKRKLARAHSNKRAMYQNTDRMEKEIQYYQIDMFNAHSTSMVLWQKIIHEQR